MIYIVIDTKMIFFPLPCSPRFELPMGAPDQPPLPGQGMGQNQMKVCGHTHTHTHTLRFLHGAVICHILAQNEMNANET